MATRKGAKKGARAKKAPAKRAKPAKRATKKAPTKKVSFGRPGTAGKAEGDAPVRAFIAAQRPEHRAILAKLDALIGETVPSVRRALKWSSPMYGQEGKGWFASIAPFKEHVNLSFFKGARLDPPVPHGDSKEMRHAKIVDDADFDEKQFRSWIRQAAAMPGWGKV